MSHPTTYAVDFDGTLCENAYPEIGAPNLPLIDKLISRRRLGAKIILWTCREGEMLTRAVEFCRSERQHRGVETGIRHQPA